MGTICPQLGRAGEVDRLLGLNWPQTPPGREWADVTLKRKVRPQQAGQEPIFSWEAKVHRLVQIQ